MPQGKGTYGSKVGRPPKKKTASKKKTTKKAASKKRAAKKMTASERAAYEFGKAAMPSKKRSSRKMTPALSDKDRAIALAKKQDSRNPASPYLISDKDFEIARLKKRSPKRGSFKKRKKR